MASNYTSLIDDIGLLDNASAPTSSATTDSPFPEPADPFDGYINITDHGYFDKNNTTLGHGIFEYIDFQSWHIYVICAVAAVIVITAVVGLIIWLSKNKTWGEHRKTNQTNRVINESSDPVLTSSYQDESGCCSCLPCCSQKPRVMEQRQNSASNLESYGRQPLPTSAYQSHQRRASQESYTIDTSNLAMYIDGIENIPNREIPLQNQRPLPSYDIQKYLRRH